MHNLTHSKQWQALLEHQQKIATTSIVELFYNDAQRFNVFSLEAANLLLDFSKNSLTSETLSLLRNLAESCQLRKQIEQLFEGCPLNTTENSPALHTALREPHPRPEISEILNLMRTCSNNLREAKRLGYTQKPITAIVNIGIGGSDLGPRMTFAALNPYTTKDLDFYFVSNIDGNSITDTLNALNPETTLFIIASKSFTTLETLQNAETAKQWLCGALGEEAIAAHFVAVTAKKDKAIAFGISPDSILSLWNWVGGRFSIWSAMGLSLMIAIGPSHFAEFLDGAHAMDRHFCEAEFDKNMPVILGLIDIWYNNFFNTRAQAITPYDHSLRLLPSYLQQLIMESNGKSVQRDDSLVTYATSPIIWGGVGVDGQHSYHQLLFQGTHLVPIDFIIPVNSYHNLDHHHAHLFANCLAQSQALMQGNACDVAHKVIKGNQPSNTIAMPKLTPFTLGALLALYEHRIFVQGAIWNINSFDQWGVEFGKHLAKTLVQQLENPHGDSSENASTQGLIDYFHRHRKEK